MLLLSSNGLTSQALMDEVGKHVQRDGKAAVVVTADNEYKEENYHVGRVVQELEQLGLSAECFDLDKQNPECLLGYDLVEFIGGNPFYLLDSLRRTNAKEILKEIMRQKILIGWSAGALVMGRSLALIHRYSPEMNFMGLEDLTGLELTDIDVLPHYNKFLQRFDNFEEICRQYEQEKKCEVIRLNDGDGVAIHGEMRVVHSLRQNGHSEIYSLEDCSFLFGKGMV